MSRPKLASKPPKAVTGRKSTYRAEAGPFGGHAFALTEASTVVFAVQAQDQQWRGRYVGDGKGVLQWQDVPIGAEHSALHTR